MRAQVKDTVITVPPFFSAHERQAVLDAATLSNMNVLALINDYLAGKPRCSARVRMWGLPPQC